MWMTRRCGRTQRLGSPGAPLASPHPGGRLSWREEPMFAANQRPITALGTALMLWGLAGCTAAGRHTVANYPAQAGPVLASSQPLEREFPVEQAPAARTGEPALAHPGSEFSSAHPQVQSFV